MILKGFLICPIFGQCNNSLVGQGVGQRPSGFIHKVIHRFWGQTQKVLSAETVSTFFDKSLQQSGPTGACRTPS
jgi:hypothetical protein